MLHHPDKNKNSEQSNRIYRIILNSYQVLSDREKRREYDEFLRKSEYIKKFGKDEKKYLGGKFGEHRNEIVEHINITLWEIDDLITERSMDGNTRRYILIILTFLDKWILDAYGFPDYFMEARRLEKRDPREYIRILGEGSTYRGHFPYSSVDEYFYDIRKRADKFIGQYEKKVIREETTDQGPGLLERIIAYNNMAIHYLSYLLDDEGGGREIPPYGFSNRVFDWWET